MAVAEDATVIHNQRITALKKPQENSRKYTLLPHRKTTGSPPFFSQLFSLYVPVLMSEPGVWYLVCNRVILFEFQVTL